MEAENFTRYKVNTKGELLPSFIIADELQGAGKHIATYIIIESNVSGDTELLINGINKVLIRATEKLEFNIEKHGVIKSIICNKYLISGLDYFIVEVGYKETLFN